MSNLKDIGQLIQVPIDQVETVEASGLPAYQLAALAEKLQSSNLRNWVPVIVQEPTPRQYRVIANEHILLSMRAAGQTYVWVAVIPDDLEAETQVKLLTGQQPLKVNLCTADYETVLAALYELRRNPSNKLEKLDITLAAERIVKAPGRRSWTALTPIPKLKCGLSTAKLPLLETVFETSPQPIAPHPVVINTASEHELLKALESALDLPEVNLANVDLELLARSIVTSLDRTYWQDLKPLTKLKYKLTPAKTKGLEQVLKIEPSPAPNPNNIRYLLELMPIKDLKTEAKQRGVAVPPKISKSELVSLLSL